MPANYTIGVDLGGTNIKAGVCDQGGTLRAHHTIDTQAERGFEHVFGRMVTLVDQLLLKAALRKEDVAAIGLGSPGPLSRAAGLIHCAPNLPGWVNIPLRARFAEATRLPVILENDANAATFGEFVAGAGRRADTMVMLTLGTGIGGGAVLDGRLWHGCHDSAAEIGHMIIVPDGRPCPCGQRGCLERYASANAVAQRLVEAVHAGADSALNGIIETGRTLDARDVLRAGEAGDKLAQRIWDETCRYLALGCVNVEHLFNPELVVLAGGLANAGPRLLAPVQEHFARARWSVTREAPQIMLATLGPQAGIIGAAALARQQD